MQCGCVDLCQHAVVACRGGVQQGVLVGRDRAAANTQPRPGQPAARTPQPSAVHMIPTCCEERQHAPRRVDHVAVTLKLAVHLQGQRVVVVVVVVRGAQGVCSLWRCEACQQGSDCTAASLLRPPCPGSWHEQQSRTRCPTAPPPRSAHLLLAAEVALAPATVLSLLAEQELARPPQAVVALVAVAPCCQRAAAKPCAVREAHGPAAVPAAVRALYAADEGLGALQAALDLLLPVQSQCASRTTVTQCCSYTMQGWGGSGEQRSRYAVPLGGWVGGW
jgi:hypothetical protein